MAPERGTVAYRWLLPITQFVLCSFVLWPVVPALMHQAKGSIHAYQVKGNSASEIPENQQVLVIPLSPSRQFDFETLEHLRLREWIPQALNLPCGLVQLPYVILNPAKQEWIPRGMGFRTWRLISWPVLGVLFWWSAGRGIEGVIAVRRRLIRPRITWIETITGAVLCAFSAVAAVCMPLFSDGDKNFPMKLFVAAFIMWSVLGGVVVAGRVAQWRLRKQLISGGQEVSPAPTAAVD